MFTFYLDIIAQSLPEPTIAARQFAFLPPRVLSASRGSLQEMHVQRPNPHSTRLEEITT
jgi:hypothetical protein